MIERSVLPETSRSTPKLRLPGPATASPQLIRFALIVLGIALITFIMYLYVLPNSQINQARTRIAQLQVRKAEVQRQESMVLQEIARGSDLKTVELRARQLGMGPVQSAIYLTMPETGARAYGESAQQPAHAATGTVEPVVQNPPLTLQAIADQTSQLLNGMVQSVDRFVSRLLGD